ncbi:hypothetical protein CVT25_013166 [Psilocybe cyanescens]|uniref:Uncharacterized protein n=1 Tax=Psilocybe cyanescens TaxID=93625 RepID=A0A409X0I5_PSICY|nr:hypothetical protein CVT25_013166 [Psilocybe cyanescens]
MQQTFQCIVPKEDDTAQSYLGPSSQVFSIIKEHVPHNTEIDGHEFFEDMPGLADIEPEVDLDSDSDLESLDGDSEINVPNKINVNGVEIEMPPSGPPKRYGYTPFIPKDAP